MGELRNGDEEEDHRHAEGMEDSWAMALERRRGGRGRRGRRGRERDARLKESERESVEPEALGLGGG